MFETLIVQPILNVLILIYALLPGHNFGIAIILFTILVRLLMHPLIKKQLHHGKAMRDLQPEIKKIKEATKDNSHKTSKLIMELYKEREVSPFSSLGVLTVQVIILVGLYTGLRQIADDPTTIISSSYEWIKNLGVMQEVSLDINNFDFTLFGVFDLSRSANGPEGIYFPALLLVTGSAIAQFFMGKQTLPEDKDSRSLKKIINDTKTGEKKVSGAEIQNMLTQSLKYLIPVAIFVFTFIIPSALALYWLTAGIVGYIQQRHILNQDEDELMSLGEKIKRKSVPKRNKS